jgi:phosphopantetheinyl transferase
MEYNVIHYTRVISDKHNIIGIIGSASDLPIQIEWNKIFPEYLIREPRQYFQSSDRERFLLSRWLLGRLIKLIEGVPVYWQDFAKDEKGQPHHKGYKGLSISHSGDYAFIVLSENSKVGCDLQQHTQINIEDYRSVFSSIEWKLITTDPLGQQFFRYWTLKEATAKMLGEGMQIDFSHILPNPDKGVVMFDQKCCYISYMETTAKYSLSVVSEHSSPNEHFRLFSGQ